MRVRRDFVIILVALSTLFYSGCSSVDSLVRSVENKLSSKQSEFDAAMIDEAQDAYKAGDILLAEERYKEYVERNQRSGDNSSLSFAYSQLGRIAHEKSDFKSANRNFEKAIELDPENFDARGMYGESLYWQKEYLRAETLFRHAIQVAPNDSRFQIMLGRTLAQQKQYSVGQRYLKQALGEQVAYEEMAVIYNSHHEYEMAAMAMNKARESHSRQRQLAANASSGSTPAMRQVTSAGESGSPYIGPSSGVAQTPSYSPPFHPPQTTPTQQGYQQTYQQAQLNALQQEVRQPQNVVIPQQNPMPNYQVQQQPQQPMMLPQYPQQQPVMSANQGYPQPMSQQPLMQNQAQGNPAAVQQVPYSGAYQPQHAPPQQAFESNPQWPQDNRPPYGFAATEQPPAAYYPMTEQQMIPGQYRQNGQEIAYSPNHAVSQAGMPQPGVPQPPMMPQGMSAPTNPLADNNAPAWQMPVQPMQPQANPNPVMPTTVPSNGWQNNPSQAPVFSGF